MTVFILVRKLFILEKYKNVFMTILHMKGSEINVCR